jgi:hypothetical protein
VWSDVSNILARAMAQRDQLRTHETAQLIKRGCGIKGRLLDGLLREVLTGACQLDHGGLAALTSRFPFADLETFDGGSTRMLELPAFTPVGGAALLGATGGWLPRAGAAGPGGRRGRTRSRGHRAGRAVGRPAYPPPTWPLCAKTG